MKSWRVTAVLLLAFGSLFTAPAAHAETFQFSYTWGLREFIFTDARVTVTVTNNITNKIGGNGEVIDTYRITVGDSVLEVTEKHDAREYTYDIVGTQTIRLQGIDRGFWAGDWGPIMTVAIAQPIEPEPTPEPTPEPISESPTISEPVEPTPEPEPVAPPQPSAAEVKEIALDVLAEYDAMWAKHGISEADYSDAREVVIFNWAKSQYLQLISENKREKATVAALSMRSQIAVIERAYLAGTLKPNPVAPIEPEPAPELQTSSPETTEPEPSVSSPVETTPVTEAPVVTPSVPEAPTESVPQPNQPTRPSLPIPVQTPAAPVQEPVVITEKSQSESSEVSSESASISQEVVEIPEATESESISETVTSNAEKAIAAVIGAFATAGLDMTPEQREKAQGVVVPSVIAAQVATLAMRRIK